MAELKKCPFCGGEAEKWSCDRLITISCKKCNYTRSFNGLVSNKKTDVPVVYEGGIVSDTEFYNRYAHEEAIEAWNNRATEAEIRAMAIDRFLTEMLNEFDSRNADIEEHTGSYVVSRLLAVAEQLKEEQ